MGKYGRQGKKLKKIREMTGMSQDYFGSVHFGVSGSTMSRWETGKSQIPEKHRKKFNSKIEGSIKKGYLSLKDRRYKI